jgi:PST family polysaccharide transporter
VWSLLFIFLGVARAHHMLNERQTHLLLLFSGIGLLVNLLGCVLLIPRYGAMGAAVATVLSQLVSALLSSFVHPATRAVGREQCLALLTPWQIGSLPALPLTGNV